jgi:hypothetical protein
MGPLFADSVLALVLFGGELVLFGFASLRHHPRAHNRFFVNISLLGIIVGTALVAVAGTQWFTLTPALWLGLVLCAALGAVCAVIFMEAMHFSYPFVLPRKSLELLLLPVCSALLPLLLAFSVASSATYLFALFFGVGMFLAAAFSVFSRR